MSISPMILLAENGEALRPGVGRSQYFSRVSYPGFELWRSIAGTRDPPALQFPVVNVLGATAYVPYAVGIGYAIGYGFGASVERRRLTGSEVEQVVVAAAIIGTIAFLAWRE